MSLPCSRGLKFGGVLTRIGLPLSPPFQPLGRGVWEDLGVTSAVRAKLGIKLEPFLVSMRFWGAGGLCFGGPGAAPRDRAASWGPACSHGGPQGTVPHPGTGPPLSWGQGPLWAHPACLGVRVSLRFVPPCPGMGSCSGLSPPSQGPAPLLAAPVQVRAWAAGHGAGSTRRLPSPILGGQEQSWGLGRSLRLCLGQGPCGLSPPEPPVPGGEVFPGTTVGAGRVGMGDGCGWKGR